MNKKFLYAFFSLVVLTSCSKNNNEVIKLINPHIESYSNEMKKMESNDSYTNYMVLNNQWDDYGIGDPYILKYNGKFYLYCSTPYGKTGIKVWESENSFDWKYVGIIGEDQQATFTAYSPKVIYENGTFYLYTTPNGDGLHILTSNSPTSNFVDVTGKMHDCIDACLFKDDDGTWYLGHGHNDGIEYHKMSDLLTIEASAYNPGCIVSGNISTWTETGNITKHDDIYYMTYSGNHVCSYAYRTLCSSSDNVLSGYVKNETPLTLSTEGNIQGTGCGLIYNGPDLINDYVVYHCLLNPNVGPIRGLCIDQVAYNGYDLVSYGVSDYSQHKGQMPTSYDYLNDCSNFEGLTSASNGFGQASSNTKVTYKYDALANYVSEFNYNPKGGNVKVDYSNDEFSLDIKTDGTLSLKIGSKILESKHNNYDTNSLHQIKTDYRNDRLKVYIDGMKKFDESLICKGGKLSATFDNDGLVGYVAFSQDDSYVSLGKEYLSYKGTRFAYNYNKDISSNGINLVEYNKKGKAISLDTNQYVRYYVNNGTATDFVCQVSYKADDDGQMVAIDEKGNVVGGFNFSKTDGKYKVGVIKGIHFDNELSTFTLAVSKGKADIYSFKLDKASKILSPIKVNTIDENGFESINGKWLAVNGNIKVYKVKSDYSCDAVYGDSSLTDYAISCKATMASTSTGDAGLLLRVNSIANTSAKYVLRENMERAYYCFIDSNGKAGICKLNYNSTEIYSKLYTSDPFATHTLEASCVGNKITFMVDGKEIYSFVDDDCCYLTGKVGLHAFYSDVSFEDIEIKGD